MAAWEQQQLTKASNPPVNIYSSWLESESLLFGLFCIFCTYTNLVPDLWLDRLPSRRQCHTYDEIIVELISKAKLIDYWRMKNPVKKQFTWFSASNNGQCSRLDYWLISGSLINEAHSCEISASPLTDFIVQYLCHSHWMRINLS